MRVITTQESYIDLEGVTDHIIRQLQLVTAGAYVLTDQGPIIMVVHHAAHMPDGKTILSPGQLEAFGCTLQETSKHFTGVQPSLTSPSGHRLPLDIRRGLPYLRLRSFTDTEWETLPHVEFTHPGPWDRPPLTAPHLTLGMTSTGRTLSPAHPLTPMGSSFHQSLTRYSS